MNSDAESLHGGLTRVGLEIVAAYHERSAPTQLW